MTKKHGVFGCAVFFKKGAAFFGANGRACQDVLVKTASAITFVTRYDISRIIAVKLDDTRADGVTADAPHKHATAQGEHLVEGVDTKALGNVFLAPCIFVALDMYCGAGKMMNALDMVVVGVCDNDIGDAVLINPVC